MVVCVYGICPVGAIMVYDCDNTVGAFVFWPIVCVFDCDDTIGAFVFWGTMVALELMRSARS